MKRIISFFFVLFITSNIYAQQEQNILKVNEYPKFFFDILDFYSYNDQKSRVDVYIQVPYRNLQFVKEGNIFVSRFELNIDVINSNDQIDVQKTFSREIPVEKFEETSSSQNHDLVQKSFFLKPGKYIFEISLTDNDSKKSFKAKKTFEVRDLNKKVAISDLMLISKINFVDGKRFIVPNISSNVGNLPEGFHVFFEFYSQDLLNDSIDIFYTITNKANKTILDRKVKQFISSNITSIFIKIDNQNLIFGDYKVIVRVNSEKYKEYFNNVGIGRIFIVRWEGMPTSIGDLNLAISQMQYIADSKDIDSINTVKEDKEKQIKFLEFWRNRNPSMEEYYARVDYANEHFKGHRDGWKTDMGMVFIIFGMPDNIDRHPFELGSVPYEIWDYYNINRRFIFVDESGFGEYRLVNPIWDKNVRVN